VALYAARSFPSPGFPRCGSSLPAAAQVETSSGSRGQLLSRGLTPGRAFDRLGSKLVTHAAADARSSSSPNMGAVLAAVGVACMGAFAFGYHLGVVNGPLETIASELGFAGNQALSGLVVSSTLLGAAVGSLTGGGAADALGRRKAFMLCAVPMFTGPLLSALATSLNQMVAGRFLAGLAIGLSSALVPLYISEVSPTAIRGTLGSLNQLMICLGILGALCINVALPATDWRLMFKVAVVPAIVLFLGMLASPESPVYLLGKGQTEEAKKVATNLWGADGPTQLGSPKSGDQKQGGWGDLFSPAYRKGVLIGCVLFVFQQFSGINAIVYFSSSVFKKAGIASGALASAAVGATNVLGTLFATGMIEKAGRKQLLNQSYTGMAITMLVMAAGFGLPALAAYSGTIALVGTLLYILSFAVGAGPVSGLIVPEINNAVVRGNAVSAAMVTHWICNVAIGQNFMAAVDNYGIHSVYAFFGVCCLAAVAYVNANVPETKGKSFEQIQAEMAAK